MNVPYTALHFAVYESAKKFMVGGMAAGSPAAAEAGGSGAGAVALLTSAAAQAAAGAPAAEGEEEEEGLFVQLVAGGTAGGLAAAATTPLDVVKTRLQLEGIHSVTRYNTTSVVSWQGGRERGQGGWGVNACQRGC